MFRIQKSTINPYRIFTFLLSMLKYASFRCRMRNRSYAALTSLPSNNRYSVSFLRYFNQACKHILFFDALSFSIINPQHEINRLKTFNHAKMQHTNPQMTSAHHTHWIACKLETDFFLPWESENSKLVFHWSKQILSPSICHWAKKKMLIYKPCEFLFALSSFFMPCGHIGLMRNTCFTATSWQYVCLKKFKNNYSNWVTECTEGGREGKNISAVVYFHFLTAHIVSVLEKNA